MQMASDSSLYHVGEKVAESKQYRLYLCSQDQTNRECLLQIATTIEQNGDLDRAAFILKELKRRADELEAEYARVKTDPKDTLNYDLGFPELVDGFICPDQGGRRVNILAFRNVEKVSKMVPLINVTAKDGLRVDLRTSAWIMGKLLKLLVFVHSEGISTGMMSSGNILIEPDQHYVLIFDWSAAQTQADVPKETQRREISQAAQAVIVVLGGNLETETIPDDGDEGYGRYADFLLQLARQGASDAARAHAEFYQLIDELWPRGFYKFTVKPLI